MFSKISFVLLLLINSALIKRGTAQSLQSLRLLIILISVSVSFVHAQSNNFLFGIAHDSPNQTNQYAYLQDLGVNIIRLAGQNAARWQSIEFVLGGGYNFTTLDNYVTQTQQAGIELMTLILSQRTQKTPTVSEYPYYNNFVKAVVERYDGDGINDAPGSPIVKYWQVDNEPNSPNWNDTPENYAKLVKNTYESVKASCDSCIVVLGGAMTDDQNPNVDFESWYDSVLIELQQLDTSGKQYFEIVDIHNYGDAFGDYKNNRKTFNTFNNLLQQYGYQNIQFVVTEEGTYSGQPASMMFAGIYQSEANQAQDLVKRYVFSMATGIKQIYWFRIKEMGSTTVPLNFPSYEGNFFSLVPLIFNGLSAYDAGDEVKKLAYYTYKKMVEVLEGSDWKNIATIQEQDGIYIYKFTKQGTPVWVVWNDSSVTKTITISGISSNRVKTIEAVPKYESGKDVLDYATAFQTDTLVVTNGAVELTLGQ
ncbi:MAG: glycoside hydrolase family 44 protein, partial [Bacteroidetes bacterium]|nr:glycoside hydrolase family 44 protein [Bacteroidota bacterium]